ncbi:FtsJ-like methyltransferase-domain-containing protein [Mycotypha africana]|uniref:FtsJ-like methyltransferase-domain-containing protein n=1 Tax=Mycotypha africana TaxID=64632 RepID=UPI0022FFCE12|nr:FtsJ-like methyltransferase-domain-containing protein [Mycotypha africana]KAI8988633.1 FtsJ-like methyltransferase-domain-containing protein [Mycotypha africana]
MSHVTKEALSTARSRSNPFERIGTSVFMNRAAVKLAALDATFGLTQKEDATSTFTFADLCGGPGGFTEYLLWRIHSWGETAHGYGITLQSTEHDEVNWQLDKFKQLAPEGSFTIVEGMDGTGDLYKEANIRHFETMVTESNHCKEGVDLVVADGGFDFSGAEGEQEIVAYRLILCEITTMLTCLKQGGHFVCKFFDMLSQSTVSLVWLLYQLFDEVCITKPLSSRPANAERYIVCKGLVHKRPAELVTKLLQMIQRVFNTTNNIKAFSLIERSVMEEDEEFIDYVQMRNMKIAMKQTEALELMNQYIQNPEASPSYDQEQIRRHLLNEWRLPSPN